MSSSSAADLLLQALALPDGDRLRLASELFASVGASGGSSVDDDDFEDVLERRSQELRDGTVKSYSIEETVDAMREAVAKRRQS